MKGSFPDDPKSVLLLRLLAQQVRMGVPPAWSPLGLYWTLSLNLLFPSWRLISDTLCLWSCGFSPLLIQTVCSRLPHGLHSCFWWTDTQRIPHSLIWWWLAGMLWEMCDLRMRTGKQPSLWLVGEEHLHSPEQAWIQGRGLTVWATDQNTLSACSTSAAAGSGHPSTEHLSHSSPLNISFSKVSSTFWSLLQQCWWGVPLPAAPELAYDLTGFTAGT